VRNNCPLSVWKIKEELNMNREKVTLILAKDLNLKVCAKMALKYLSSEQKTRRKNTWSALPARLLE